MFTQTQHCTVFNRAALYFSLEKYRKRRFLKSKAFKENLKKINSKFKENKRVFFASKKEG
jgi:hypothetical protein